MTELFYRDVKPIGKHINNALKKELDNEMVVAKFEAVQKKTHNKFNFQIVNTQRGGK